MGNDALIAPRHAANGRRPSAVCAIGDREGRYGGSAIEVHISGEKLEPIDAMCAAKQDDFSIIRPPRYRAQVLHRTRRHSR